MNKLSDYEADMRSRKYDLDYDRAEFMARPSIMKNIAVYKIGELFSTHNESGQTITTGKSPNEVLQKWDKWFYTGKVD